MICYAKLVTESAGSAAVSESLNTDNVVMNSLSVETSLSGNRVTSEIRSDSLNTLLSTLDDLLRCQITSESMIDNG
ncbi:MAG: hypothetical protein GF414_06830 [Candidatus Altiarchaeales archaeon]|nr:hypothetical protein [Candidatus Altiarchaeales archaeon]